MASNWLAIKMLFVLYCFEEPFLVRMDIFETPCTIARAKAFKKNMTKLPGFFYNTYIIYFFN